ncbi:hypothetical protein K491DRAFT_462296 [Lophiostoma macrostomum CBS 122681]|uniref:Uncharacterized protein n=1 Tax=Lophiostoma macrostomum CBS 122681 TaxID=1314788 RepID=A0A6A6T772_9PLEO|nr:hypothetical protein K491DRAFT_462296 [Lophiostoma macrostomum CBS 122681]
MARGFGQRFRISGFGRDMVAGMVLSMFPIPSSLSSYLVWDLKGVFLLGAGAPGVPVGFLWGLWVQGFPHCDGWHRRRDGLRPRPRPL